MARRVLAQGHPVSAPALVEMVTSGAAAIAGLGDHSGSIEPGRRADLLAVERRHEDPWLNVVEAEPSWVQLVCVNGAAVYARPDWIATVASPTEATEPKVAAGPAAGGPVAAAGPTPEPVLAWGRPIVPAASLTDLRRALIAQYPQTGPILD